MMQVAATRLCGHLTIAAMTTEAKPATASRATNGAAVTDKKLVELRKSLASAEGGAGVDAYIIPTEDPHMVCRPSLHLS